MNTADLLDQVKARHGLPSDYALAKFMQWTTQRVSMYRHGARALGEGPALQVAAALDVEPGYVLAIVAAERAESDEGRRAWERAAARLSIAAGAVFTCWVLSVALPGSEALAGSFGASLQTLVIMSNAAGALLAPVYLGAVYWALRPQIVAGADVIARTLKVAARLSMR